MNTFATFARESRAARFLIPAGLILIIFGVIMFVVNKQNKDYISTESTVTKVEAEEETDSEKTYTVIVKYTVNDKEYEAELGGLSEYKEGDRIKIYYNPDDPGQITMTKSMILPVAIIAGGIAALAGGIFSGINAVKRYKRMKEQEKEWSNG